MRRLSVYGIPAVLAMAGCAGRQSALDPAGPQAGRIYGLWWLFCAVCLAVYVVVILLTFGALMRRAQRRRPAVLLRPPAEGERRLTRNVTIGVALTTLTLFVLLAGDFLTGRAITSLEERDPLAIRVTGHQWWWEVQYQDKVASNMFTTANEIHIPVGRTVRFDLDSADVIHSFWIPNLHGKRDMIPTHPTSTFVRADRPGTFIGQCAEFCGLQHSFMRLVVVAEAEEAFLEWAQARRKPAVEPEDEHRRRGRQVFLGSSCVMCHTIRGTEAGSRFGPDLTHIGSRPLIGGILANTRGHLAGWVVDPQRIKPGVRMPLNVVRPTDLDALVDFLTSLK
jgi:cytochrome c oxidase subunit 2